LAMAVRNAEPSARHTRLADRLRASFSRDGTSHDDFTDEFS